MWLVGVVSVLAAGLVAGGLVMVQLAIVPLFKSLSLETSREVHLVLDKRIDRFMPQLTLLSIGLSVAEATINSTKLSQPVSIVAAVLMACVAAISIIGNGPLNEALRTSNIDRLTPGYLYFRRRWNRWHLARTSAGLLGFCAVAVSVMWERGG